MFNSRKRKLVFVPLQKHDREAIRQNADVLAKKLTPQPPKSNENTHKNPAS